MTALHLDPKISELFPEIQLAPVTTKKRAPKVKPNMESMAQTLEGHSDYRVLRRLKPCFQWAGEGVNPVVKVVVLDTETTGLDHAKDKIIELAILRVDVDTVTGQPVGAVQVYDGLEDPGIAIPQEITGITGITNADVNGKRIDELRVAELMRDIDLVIAHNAGFDRPFFEARLPQFCNQQWACSFADIDWKAQNRSSAKLENLALSIGLFYDAHRAEMDCHALLKVLVAELPAGSSTGLNHLIHAAKYPSYRVQATNAPFDAKDKLKGRGYRWNAEQKVWHTRLGTETALDAECDWLKANVYHQRAAVVQVEKLTATVKYSTRPGEVLYRQL